VIIGLLSIPPTLAYLKWRKKCTTPTDEAVANLRRYLWIESGSACTAAGLCSANGSRVRPVLIEISQIAASLADQAGAHLRGLMVFIDLAPTLAMFECAGLDAIVGRSVSKLILGAL